MPSNHHFGISAASAETPDSFEAYKFIVHSSGSPTSTPPHHEVNQQSTNSKPSSESSNHLSKESRSNLETQLQSLISQIEHLQSQLTDFDSKSSMRHAEIKNNPSMANDQFKTLNNRISNVETLLQQLQKDIHGYDYKAQLAQIQESLKESHESLMTYLPHSVNHVLSTVTPKTSGWVLLMVLLQVGCAIGYAVHKMRRRGGEKKFV